MATLQPTSFEEDTGAGRDVISAKGNWAVSQPPSFIGWPSIYHGIGVIHQQNRPPSVQILNL
ncbi:hypothetical protein PISMIDRAFT_13018 [Pisolithus microcarpus 441]|uniref:Uncharacterized protein n=1 Tax=Pisolithus microcarpus 441 TaxID=765257 RepID=A0A0C9ZDB3_9AGAM|nr:hypothetical protein PISMIDRAFT_13018 [Pisolithus microcarpus 441]